MDFSGTMEISEVGSLTIELSLEDGIKYLHITDNRIEVK